jgi:predicted O-methyltransferase YrrM
MRLLPSLLLRLNPYRGNRQLGYAAALAKVFGASSETTHPHVSAEQAELYSAIDVGSAELEVLECLHSLVYLFKPRFALETGSYRGFSAMAIASAMRRNGRGRLISVETDPGAIRLSKRHLNIFDPASLELVQFELAESRDFLRAYSGQRFEFMFLDSDITARVQELEILQERALIAPDAICVIHDTSRSREQYRPGEARNIAGLEVFDRLARLYESFEFPYARGFRFLKFTRRGC